MCLSRVALGVHSPLDITIGALTGALIGGLILKLGLLNRLIQEEKTQE
ncbi:MAG: phosphatase PAP2 family protein [Verrucomicrobiota bacterium]|nr:phosphatase PAP2 family protein [Verrucomicrobiota bacterium]